MHVIKKNKVVRYTPSQIYALVSDVERYPEFLKWCSRAKVKPINQEEVEATLWINYLALSVHFTTRNTLQPNNRITMTLVDGPFSALEGEWCFVPTPDQGCDIRFQISYRLAASFLGMALTPIFHGIANTLVESFVREADRLFGDEKA